ncbi:choice-of-anchor J domain-containing protein [Lacinutrix mariniflava]|uniref:choice-of-anchor J domain-containing protein n=1 Tax=Lacinutrix mariniflava TaxID=342955 RepID=UPI0006E43B0F|nr:choice-of-anchor J domain-containing protein [Lacinutrix mariniflava]
MKKIVYLLAIIGASVLTGCNPLEDINNDIDSIERPIVGDDVITLTTDDYAAIVEQGEDDEPDYYETFEAFSSVDDAKNMLPPFLSSKYPLWGQGSSVLVNYNLYDGNPSDVSSFVNADSYTLVSEDYPIEGANAFYQNEDSQATISNLLLNEIATPEIGDVVRAQYRQFTEEPVVGFAALEEYVFEDNLAGWSTEEVSGNDSVWLTNSSYIQGNGFINGAASANEEWLVSPAIDLAGETNVKFQIAHAIKYANDPSVLKILVSTDYANDIATATWDEITLATPASEDDLDPSEDYDFSAYDGQTVNIALKYVSTLTNAGRWRVASVTLKTVGIEGDTLTKSDYYQFSEAGTWELVNDVRYLTSDDYDFMGESQGQPGQFNNFSGSLLASDYLPAFLSLKYPFAQEEDSMYIMYRYYAGSTIQTITKGNLYTVINGVWTPSIASLQFGFDNGIWVPDNTIKYTLVSADYSYAASQLLTTEGFEAAAANLNQYGNFNTATGTSGWSTEMVATAMAILLDNLYPNAEEAQKYLLTFDIFNAGPGVQDMHLIKTNGEWVLFN